LIREDNLEYLLVVGNVLGVLVVGETKEEDEEHRRKGKDEEEEEEFEWSEGLGRGKESILPSKREGNAFEVELSSSNTSNSASDVK
jgi:hypothetical protein